MGLSSGELEPGGQGGPGLQESQGPGVMLSGLPACSYPAVARF